MSKYTIVQKRYQTEASKTETNTSLKELLLAYNIIQVDNFKRKGHLTMQYENHKSNSPYIKQEMDFYIQIINVTII